MPNQNTKFIRILAIVPSPRGFGHALVEGPSTLIDWGVKGAKGDKNAHCLKNLTQMIDRFTPAVLVLENLARMESRRGPRVEALVQEIKHLAHSRKLKVQLVLRKDVQRTFSPASKGTNHDIAKSIAEKFPEELGHRLPPRRRFWMNEDYRMGIFKAVGLALTAFHLREKKRQLKAVKTPVGLNP